MIRTTYLLGVLIALGASLALAIQNISISKGTDTGRAYDAVLTVMLTNIFVLVPAVAVYYYPNYGITTASALSFVAAGIFGTMLGRAFKYVSIGRIGASRTEPIIRTSALVAALLGVIILGERVVPLQLVAILGIIGGVVIISLETTRENPQELPRRKLLVGMVLPFAGAVAYGIEPIFAAKGLQTGTPPPIGVAIKTFAATLGFAGYLRIAGELPPISSIVTSDNRFFLFAGLGNTTFQLGYYTALGLAPVSIVVPIIPTSTLFTIVIAALVMPQRLEHVTAKLVGAALVIVAGVVTLTIVS